MDNTNALIQLAPLPIKHTGLAVPNPIDSCDTNHKTSSECVKHLVESIKGEATFCTASHQIILKETKTAAKKQKKIANEAKFNSILKDLPKAQQGPVKRARETGQFLLVLPSTIHGTDLSADEF
jgi:hypothetical protein